MHQRLTCTLGSVRDSTQEIKGGNAHTHNSGRAVTLREEEGTTATVEGARRQGKGGHETFQDGGEKPSPRSDRDITDEAAEH